MDVEKVIEKNISLAITNLNLDEIELDFQSVKDETFKEKVFELFEKLKEEPNPSSRTEAFDEVGSIINVLPPPLDYRQIKILQNIKKLLSL